MLGPVKITIWSPWGSSSRSFGTKTPAGRPCSTSGCRPPLMLSLRAALTSGLRHPCSDAAAARLCRASIMPIACALDRRIVAESAAILRSSAQAIGMIDALQSLAAAGSEHGWRRPEVNAALRLSIKGGRHPLVEHGLPAGVFVPNDLELDPQGDQIVILTGPNMAGKSTYLRQAAVIVLLAQCGSFVPAESAVVGLADRIFTRVGAHDDITAGMSTFMVEMTETANILNHATRSSLVILDEVGRGTSTYDGLSIAQAVVEHIHDSPKLGCRTLFATHYHELTTLAERLPRVSNQRVEVLEDGATVRFLHRVVPGGADRSYGIHVAALAGLPSGVLAVSYTH